LLYRLIRLFLRAIGVWSWWLQENPNNNNTPTPTVNPQLIDAVQNLRNDEMDIHRRWLDVGSGLWEESSIRMVIQPQDAAYIVKELREILRLEEKENMDNKNKRQQSSSSSRTGLFLNNICFSSNSLHILCTFLQQTDHNLTALHLGSMHSTEFLPILAALQHSNNKSVQALTISRGGRTTLSTGLVQLLQSKSGSLQALNFVNVDFGGDFLQGCGILSCLGRSTLPDLRKLSFTACCIDDDGIESIIEALVSELVDDNVDNTRPHGQQRQRRHFVSSPVQELDFSNNDIASGGLQRSLCTYVV
jgi:Leucine Rich repeat